MSTDVDELFGEGGGAPTPRTSLALALLVAGLVLAVVGMVCSAAPGGVAAAGGSGPQKPDTHREHPSETDMFMTHRRHLCLAVLTCAMALLLPAAAAGQAAVATLAGRVTDAQDAAASGAARSSE